MRTMLPTIAAVNPPVADVSVVLLAHAKSAMGATFTGWKGGEFTMGEYTDCHIGEYGTCGEEITSAHLKLWLLTANAVNDASAVSR